jgi:hypothetical protein
VTFDSATFDVGPIGHVAIRYSGPDLVAVTLRILDSFTPMAHKGTDRAQACDCFGVSSSPQRTR